MKPDRWLELEGVLTEALERGEDVRDAWLIQRCGGDTDTTAAILGSILGAASGKDGIPSSFLLVNRAAEVAMETEAQRSNRSPIEFGNRIPELATA